MGRIRRPLRFSREAIIETLPDETSLYGGMPEVRFTYVPASHAKALHPDTQVVMGMRGAGKSFWWAALQEPAYRELVGKLESRTGLTEDAEIEVGYGERALPGSYPGRDLLEKLVAEKYEPRLVWRTVIVQALVGRNVKLGDSWSEKVAYVSENPEEVENILYRHDQKLVDRDKHWIILFDALDRSASNWSTMHRLIRGLLQVTLDLRSYRRLRAKCFLRTDQLDEGAVADFPDASKVLSSKIELSWPARELYGLLFQYLGNWTEDSIRKGNESFFCEYWKSISVAGETIWLPIDKLRRDEQVQRTAFHAITGPFMGRDRRRGFPYTWVPNHLADAEGRTSPRSFIAALRKAAEDSQDRYQEYDWPLHYESIKRGVQEASSIRRREIQEDHPWVDALMQPLRGIVVPCPFEKIADRWKEEGGVNALSNKALTEQEGLTPAHLDDGPDGVRKDLEDLGVFMQLKDGRVNIPDVFRVGYGLGRRGGVRPIRRS